jgi:hypothetical protein
VNKQKPSYFKLVKSVENANPKAIDSWIKNISDLQKNKPVQIVNYQKFVFIHRLFSFDLL